MAAGNREKIESELTESLLAGAHAEVAERIVRGYGPEILGFLHGTLKDPTAADDVFSIFCEELLRGVAGFQRKSSFRTWSYAVARNAAYHYRLARQKRGHREHPLSQGSPISAVAENVRSETAQYLRTEVKSRFAALRDALTEEDRMILVLRVDKRLAFDEIARVMLSTDDAEPQPADIKREAARLRKRFQIVKDRLVAKAKGEGLVGDE